MSRRTPSKAKGSLALRLLLTFIGVVVVIAAVVFVVRLLNNKYPTLYYKADIRHDAADALRAGDIRRAEEIRAFNRIEEVLSLGPNMTQEQADEAYRKIQMLISQYPELRESMEALYVNFPPNRLRRARDRYALTGGR